MKAKEESPIRLDARQRVILLLLLGAGFMLSVDFSILNVALPEAGAGVGLGTAQLAWIVSAYALPAAGLTLLSGRLADLFGRRKLFLAGMALLAAASLLGGFANTPEVLLTARVLQGVASAMTIPASLSLITTTFAEGRVRERALGLNGALLSAGFTVGALVGGMLVSLLSWRAAFFINVPVAIVIGLLAIGLIKESRTPDRVKLDVPGAVTVTLGLLAVIYAVIERNLLVGVVGAGLLVAFWAIERRTAQPLVPIRILRRPSIRWGNVAALTIFALEPAMIFLATLYMQTVLELSALVTGLVFGIPGLVAVFAGPIAGRLIGRIGVRTVLFAGMLVQGLAILPMVFVGASRWSLVLVAVGLFVSFFGHVSAIVSSTVTATSGLPNEEQGLATGLSSMTQQVGITVGIPILAAVAAMFAPGLTGIRFALAVVVVVTVLGALAVRRGLRDRANVPASVPEAALEPAA